MSLPSILLATFLILFGVIYGFGISFQYSALVVGGLSVAAGVVMFANRITAAA